ncbi:MAG: DNA-processing protein DprA [Planctomycetota bacterium]|nr:DNA-processing protein DprA [Planctomycetota bacterium]
MDDLNSRLERLGQRRLLPDDGDWPSARLAWLAQERDAPKALFVKGELPRAGTYAVAIVGTRRATHYGLEVAREMARDLARLGVWIVSGFALGVDTAAHEGALQVDGGRTLAVLGTGIDVPYPASNAELRTRVPEAGALVSEYEPGERAAKYHFPRRNRLIAAFADVVLVVEAPERSGALITARNAVEMGRTVLAVPGHIRRTTQAGCHKLLRDDVALLCTEVDDVLEALDHPARRAARDRREVELTPSESAVLDQLDLDDAAGPDAITRGSGLSPAAVMLALTRLELEGLARRIPGVGYVRR